ncbi:MAG: IS3 family transposase [Chitinophagales bacterium]
MKKSRFSETQIVGILKQHEQGLKVADICRQHSISSATFFNWKSKYGGMQASDIKRLRELEEENRKLKQMYADLALDNRILKDIIGKKALTPCHMKELATGVSSEYCVSIGRACRIINLPRSMYYYESKRDDTAVIDELSKLAEQLPTNGFPEYFGRIRRVHQWNHKRVRRVYRKMGLHIRCKHKRRLPQRIQQPLQQQPSLNKVWRMDFMQDSLTSGRKFRVLNVIDDFNRQGLAIRIATSFPGQEVTRILTQLIEEYGKPKRIRTDNGPEYISRSVQEFMQTNEIKHQFIQPGKPTQNAYIERFNRIFRTAVLNAYLFDDINQVRALAGTWLDDFNRNHPHKSLFGLSPIEFREDVNSGKLVFNDQLEQFTTIHIPDDGD